MSSSCACKAKVACGCPKPVYVDNSKHVFKAKLCQLNNSGAHGEAVISLCGDIADITICVYGVSGGLQHAQHIHINGRGECPGAECAVCIDTCKGPVYLIRTSDGHAAYGEIGTSLTLSGDTSPASGLALDRFPRASCEGAYIYKRITRLSYNVIQQLKCDNAVIVIHGLDFDHNGCYDFKCLGVSDLDPKVSLEATLPVACGALHKVCEEEKKDCHCLEKKYHHHQQYYKPSYGGGCSSGKCSSSGYGHH